MFGLFGDQTLLKFGATSAPLLALLPASFTHCLKKLSQMMEAFQQIGGVSDSDADKCIIV
jgi:hypothetical protein